MFLLLFNNNYRVQQLHNLVMGFSEFQNMLRSYSAQRYGVHLTSLNNSHQGGCLCTSHKIVDRN